MRPNILPCRLRSDSQGHGAFGAPRGGKTHRGVDYVCSKGDPVYSPVEGEVTKHGKPYAGDNPYRYIEVTDDTGLRHRLFYTIPLVKVGEIVQKNQIIAEAQDISERYPDAEKPMTPHVHYEVKDKDGNYRNPEEL